MATKYQTNRQAIADSRFGDLTKPEGRLNAYLKIKRLGKVDDATSLLNFVTGADRTAGQRGNVALNDPTLVSQALRKAGIDTDAGYEAFLNEAYGEKPAPASGRTPTSRAANPASNPLYGQAKTEIRNGVRMDLATGKPYVPVQSAVPVTLAPAPQAVTPAPITPQTFSGPAGSVVDFLKSRGIQGTQGEAIPLFDTRKQLFELAGLSPTKTDEYRGTAAENQALANFLAQAERKAGVSITPDNLFSIVKLATGQGAAPAAPAASYSQGNTRTLADGTVQQLPDRTGGGSSGGSSSQSILDQLYKMPTAKEVQDQALKDVTTGSIYELEKDEADAERAQLQLEAQREKEKTIQDLAAKGMTFSGKKTADLAAIDADKLAKTLGVDRRFALMIARGLESSAQAIVKDAQAGQKSALESLEALGYSINPITGQVEPTLAARNAAAQEARFQQEQATDYPASYKEYLMLKQEGYTGSYNDYQTMDANRKASAGGLGNAIALERLGLSIDAAALDQKRFQFQQEQAKVGTTPQDIAAYSFELQTNPAFDITSVPQEIRGQVLQQSKKQSVGAVDKFLGKATQSILGFFK